MRVTPFLFPQNANSCPVDRTLFKCICIRAQFGGKVLKKVSVYACGAPTTRVRGVVCLVGKHASKFVFSRRVGTGPTRFRNPPDHHSQPRREARGGGAAECQPRGLGALLLHRAPLLHLGCPWPRSHGRGEPGRSQAWRRPVPLGVGLGSAGRAAWQRLEGPAALGRGPAVGRLLEASQTSLWTRFCDRMRKTTRGGAGGARSF